jgi:predicted phage terminase large subunit-like protein
MPSTRQQVATLLRKVYRLTVTENEWICWPPTLKQEAFLVALEKEILFGGSAGGAKSIALLMAALQYVDIPGYAALLLRRTYSDLRLPGALMARAHEWLGGTPAKWHDDEHRWEFPSGASLQFGYLERANDHYRYQSSEFQFVGFDELTQFEEQQYLYLFSRLRRREGVPIPLRMRAASNPGGLGHLWVKERFLGPPADNRLFIPARLTDNPHIDQEEYRASLSHLDPVTRARLLNGDWSISEGGMFRRDWFGVIDAERLPAGLKRRVRFWDLASTDGGGDWTVGVLMGRHEGVFFILDVRRLQGSPGDVEQVVKQTAAADGRDVPVYIEQEPGSAGKYLISSFVRALAGYTVRGERATGNKSSRAAPVASQAEAGNVKLVRAGWNKAFLDELELFPRGAHDDQVDAASGCLAKLTTPQATGKPVCLGGGISSTRAP